MILVRFLILVVIVIGVGLFIVLLLFFVLGGNVGEVGLILVGMSFKFMFMCCFGCL